MSRTNRGAFRLVFLAVLVVGSALALLAVSTTRAQQQSRDQQRCILAVNKATRGVARAQAKLIGSCIKQASSNGPVLAPGCIAADLKQKVAAARQKTVAAVASSCAVLPSFGFTGATTANDAAVAQELNLLADVFGDDLGDAVIPANNPAGARCQQLVRKSYDKIFQAQIRTFEACKKAGLKSGTIDSQAALAACFDAVSSDMKGRIGKAVVKLADTLASGCTGVDTNAAFPGSCSFPGFTDCVHERSACRACLLLDETDATGVQCDAFDNGTADASCIDPRRCGDGVVDPGEECDDDNNVDGDCCSATCTSEPNGQACNDLVFCNGADTCLAGSCSVHTGDPCGPPDGDGNCADACNEVADNCTGAAPNGSPCDDGVFCNGADTCSAGACTTHPGDPCPGADGDGDCSESCDEASDDCAAADTDGMPCDDGLFCNGADVCAGGACETLFVDLPCPGADGDADCSESCNEAADNCTANDPNGSACTDNLFCNGADTCSTGTCSGHAGNPCSGPDGDSDCSESCDETTDDCGANDPNGSGCNDGTFCNGADSCFAGACTLHAGNPCPGPDGDGDCSEICDEAADACSANDPDGAVCDDGLFCNGTDSCAGGTCSSHVGNPCSGADGDADCSETCDEAANNCNGNDPNGSSCTDGIFCNGADTCLAGACTVHPGNPCPGPDGDSNCAESCNELGANCAAADPNGSTCNDSLFCNGADTCSAGVCSVHAGNPCPGADGDGDCTEMCNEAADNCEGADPNGSACNNGLGCDGSDSCSGGSCVPSGVCCGTVDFTFTVNSNSGGAFDSAEWPGGQQAQSSTSGCSVTINNPNNNIDAVCTLGAPFSVAGFSGFQSCFGFGGEDGDGCQPVFCPPAGIGSCCSVRPSCSAALNGSAQARYFVRCVDP